jgi:uncharacterized membrane protein HdeD (DUF308 family)
MEKSTKIWLVISGIILVVLGVFCIAKPGGTLITSAWLIGCFTLISGISKLIFTFRTQRFLPNSASRFLSALLQIFIGCFFLFDLLETAVAIPVVFSLWIMFEGIIIAIQSFDYKKVGFGQWWAMLILGIAGAILGIYGMINPVFSGTIISTLIGLGIIAFGIAYLMGFAGIKKFEKAFDIK